MAIEIRVPSLGESISEATVGQWLKQQGDQVAADEPLVELETDKVTVEVPAPASGILERNRRPLRHHSRHRVAARVDRRRWCQGSGAELCH